MIEELARKRMLDASAVTVVAAGLSRLVSWAMGYYYGLPMLLVDGITGSREAVSYLLTLVLVPLVGAVLWRRPAWVRWACLGVLLHNVWWAFFVRIF